MDAPNLTRSNLNLASTRTEHTTRIARSDTFANLLRFLALLMFAAVVSGCGSQPGELAGTQTVDSGAQASGAKIAAISTELQPMEIVSQLLDRVRRGGQEASSSELLTKLAQQELARIGRPFEFPGSPDTLFEVRDVFPVPDEQDAVWVHTYLSEPSELGQNVQYEVVWTLRKEPAGWRVSGFVIDQGNEMEPLVFNFENGDEMAAQLAALEQADGPSNR